MFEDDQEIILKARNKKDYDEGFSDENEVEKEKLPSSVGMFTEDGGSEDDIFGADSDMSIFDDMANESAKKTYNRDDSKVSSGSGAGVSGNNFGGGVSQEGQGSSNLSGKPKSTQVVIAVFNSLMSAFTLLIDIVQSFAKNDLDTAYQIFFKISVICGVMEAVSIVLYVMGDILDSIKLNYIGINCGIATGINVFVGIVVIVICNIIAYKPTTLEQVKENIEKETVDTMEEEIKKEIHLETEYKRDMEDIMKEVLGDEYDEYGSSDNDSEDNNSSIFDSTDEDGSGDDNEEAPVRKGLIDLEDLDDNDNNDSDDDGVKLNMAGIVSREALFYTFNGAFKVNCPEYSNIKTYNAEDMKFRELETILQKAFANVVKKPLEDVANMTHIIALQDSILSVEIVMNRIQGKDNLGEIAKQIDAYSSKIMELMCDKKQLYIGRDAIFNEMSTRVDIENDNYKIIISKPNKKAILVGDVIKKKEVAEYLTSQETNLPIVLGIDELGNPMYEDLRYLSSGIIGGKARSGKSWFTASLMAQLFAFNSPEDIQCVLIDPKATPLFKALSLMPHCAGFFTPRDKKGSVEALRALKDICDKESERRIELLQQYNCDDIWALRNKGVKLPVLFVFIDEYMSLHGDLEEASKKDKSKKDAPDYLKHLNIMINKMMTKFPYIGIYTFMVSHTFNNIIEKNTRMSVMLKAVMRNDELKEQVFESVDLEDFSKRLVQAGDTAIKTSGKVKYIRSLGVALQDEDVAETIKKIAKGYYKMGVDIPNLQEGLQRAYNRDNDKIMQELRGENKNTETVQFDADEDEIDL